MPERILHKAKEARLTDAEKSSMRMSLETFMASHPVSSVSAKPVESPYGRLYAFMLQQKKLVPVIAVFALVVLTGGTAFAANDSLPGDALYPIKINVNENVETFLAFGSEANAKIKTSQASRRLEEAERLAVKGKLDASAKLAIENSFRQSAEEATRSIKALKASGNAHVAVAISSDFESSLAAHEEVLNTLSVGVNQDNGSSASLDSIASVVHQRLATVTETRARAELLAGDKKIEEGLVRVSAEGALVAAQRKADGVRKYAVRQVARGRISEEVRVSIDARVGEAEKIIVDGKAKLEAGSYGEAFVALKTAERAVQGVRSLASSLAKAGVKTAVNVRVGTVSTSSDSSVSTAVASVSATSSGHPSTASVAAKVNATAGTGTPTAAAAAIVTVGATTSATSASSALFSMPASVTATATVNAVIDAVVPVSQPSGSVQSGAAAGQQSSAQTLPAAAAGIVNTVLPGLKK